MKCHFNGKENADYCPCPKIMSSVVDTGWRGTIY
jgi:predicted nucleic acid-binding Zn finger protein